VRLFRLSPREAWNLEWGEFAVLVEAHQEAERMADYRAGVVAAVVANANRGPETPMYKPGDFFASLEEEDEEMTSEETGEFFKSLVLAMGGNVVIREA